ncbi:sugar-binding transcriptional regulator [Paracoccus xiamenensis]|uniref:sugar-binding transcriptional regulator n=1 Tax=Paracoccus xiamenensis TaxID=2714901 RepID=UPI001407C064|nr:sugar-binding domain-containing protein [Paracoccus xiamenensis]NHF73513.1 MarR family transcriptional regulator [Paracoccus xiamenensis]
MSRDDNKLDQAVRAAWMSWVGKLTQDEIAREMGVSRQTAQRLVAQAMAAGVVKVRIDHPLADCLDLGQQLKDRFDLRLATVAPDAGGRAGVAMQAAELIEAQLGRTEPITLAIGTGRMLRAAVAQMHRLDCPQHRIVSLTGNIARDGSAAYYNVLFTLSELVTASSYPLMVPVIAAASEERQALHRQPGISRVMQMAEQADTAIIGLGDLGPDAPLRVDRFLSQEEVNALTARGGVGEILGRPFDIYGRLLPLDGRVASARLPAMDRALVVAVCHGPAKHAPVLGALRGRLINGLLCDETTARWLLAQPPSLNAPARATVPAT